MRCRNFYFLVKFGLVLIHVLRFIVKNLLRWEKICSIHYLHFSFEKHVHFQVLKDFSVENLQTNPCPFLSKFSCEIYLSRIINYWGSIFKLYCETFSLVCVLTVSFFLSFFSFFRRYFPWSVNPMNLSLIHKIGGKG